MKGNKKYTIEQIRISFEAEGYQLLTTDYKNTKQKLEFICPQGHNHFTTWDYWNGKRKLRCGKCKYVTFEQVKKSFESESYQLLSLEYINNISPLEYICPKGHKHNITWSRWQYGIRCSKCVNSNIKENKYNIIKDLFKMEGYQLLSNVYKDNNQKLDFICPKGHKHSMRWGDWQQGYRCGQCFGTEGKITYDIVKQSFIKEDYQLLSTDYKNAKSKLRFLCPKGHKHQVTWDKWKQGHRCGKCRASKPEIQLLNYIMFVYPHIKIIHQDRNQIFNPSTGKGLEFDVWFPELNKAIEMDGINVHLFKGRPEMDELKNQLCEEKGIPLLRITDEEWYTSDKVRTKIHQFINQ